MRLAGCKSDKVRVKAQGRVGNYGDGSAWDPGTHPPTYLCAAEWIVEQNRLADASAPEKSEFCGPHAESVEAQPHLALHGLRSAQGAPEPR